ncbi:MAG: hypothetical protein PVI21_06560 [Candidatus Woesebacteria bacterium]|jgi:hypothetical protein
MTEDEIQAVAKMVGASEGERSKSDTSEILDRLEKILEFIPSLVTHAKTAEKWNMALVILRMVRSVLQR